MKIMEYYSAIKSETLTCIRTWMNLQNLGLNERKQRQQTTHHKLYLEEMLPEGVFLNPESRSVGTVVLGVLEQAGSQV